MVLGYLDSIDTYFGTVDFLLGLDFDVCILFFHVFTFVFCMCMLLFFNFQLSFISLCVFFDVQCVKMYTCKYSMYKLHQSTETSLLYIYSTYYKKCILYANCVEFFYFFIL